MASKTQRLQVNSKVGLSIQFPPSLRAEMSESFYALVGVVTNKFLINPRLKKYNTMLLLPKLFPHLAA